MTARHVALRPPRAERHLRIRPYEHVEERNIPVTIVRVEYATHGGTPKPNSLANIGRVNVVQFHCNPLPD